MANLKNWQNVLSTSTLYKVKPAPNRNVLKPSIFVQGDLSADTIDLYIALDGSTEDTNPASLTEMSKIEEGLGISKALESFDINFIAFVATGSPKVILSGFDVEDLGAIS